MKQTALLLIDIQNDYFPGGKMELEGASEAVEMAREVLFHFREMKGKVIHVQHESSQADAPFFIPGTVGMEIQKRVKALKSEEVILKHSPNSFAGTQLELKLKEAEIKNLIVVGMMSWMCVDSTVRAAFDLGFKSTVLHDATASKELQLGSNTVPADQVQVAFMAALGFGFAKIQSTHDFIKENHGS